MVHVAEMFVIVKWDVTINGRMCSTALIGWTLHR